MKSFFISFATHDLPVAEYVCRYLSDLFKGKASFFLSDMIEPGTDWLKAIKMELKHADAGFILTPFSINRPWIYIEFGAFWAHGRRIFPVLAGQLALDQVPRPLVDFQAAVLSDENAISKLFRQVAKICDCVLPQSFEPKQFCSHIRKILSPPRQIATDLPISTGELKKLKPETIYPGLIEAEPADLKCRILTHNTLSVSGKLLDAGIIAYPFYSAKSPKSLVIEVSNSEGMVTCYRGQNGPKRLETA